MTIKRVHTYNKNTFIFLCFLWVITTFSYYGLSDIISTAGFNFNPIVINEGSFELLSKEQLILSQKKLREGYNQLVLGFEQIRGVIVLVVKYMLAVSVFLTALLFFNVVCLGKILKKKNEEGDAVRGRTQ